MPMTQHMPTITAIVSTYKAERFIRACMDDLVAQTIFDDIEVIVIDSGSPENESAIVAEYVKAYPDQIRLLRTEREPLYAAWNRGIAMARGRYLTNANTDDRHRADSFEQLSAVLDSHPEVGLVYADQWISTTENETFAECEERGAKRRRWPDFTHKDLMLRCITGPQPMWRRSLHDELGVFDTRYRIAADYDMWMRVATRHSLMRLDLVCGVFFDSPNTISGKANRVVMNAEVLEIQGRYSSMPPWNQVNALRPLLAATIFGVGYQHVEADHDNRAAAPFFRKAIELDPLNFRYLKTWVIRCLLNIQSR